MRRCQADASQPGECEFQTRNSSATNRRSAPRKDWVFSGPIFWRGCS